MSDALLQRRDANRQIEYFLTQHSLNFFGDNRPEQSADNARTLHHYLRVLHQDDQVKIVANMRSIADDIAALDLSHGGPADGHHQQAAEAILAVATEIEVDNCPWSDLYHLMGNTPLLQRLASSLWKANRRREPSWNAQMDVITREVWGDVLVPCVTIRSAVSRLAKWLTKNDVNVELKVKGSQQPPHIACKIGEVAADPAE